MERTIILLTASALLAACASKSDSDPTLNAKRAERDSLKAAYAAVGQQLKTVEEWLAEHDSTLKRDLPDVTAFTLQPSTFEHFVQVHGSVKADKSAELYSMGGRVRSILVKEGDHVSSGQLLVDLDNDAIEKQVAAAEAGASLADDVYNKQKALWEQKIGSEVQYLQAKSAKEQADANLASVREQLRMSRITAPFNGVVDDIMVTEGDMTAPQFPVARVVDLAGASLEADVPESYVKAVKAGDPVQVEFPSLGDTITASISNVSRFIDPANRTFKVTVRVQGDELIRPNLLSVIHIRDQVADSALVVPSRVVQEDVNGNRYLFTLDEKDGRTITRKVMVKPVAEYRRYTMVTTKGELKGGERIVDEGARSVADGQEVNVTTL